MAMGLSLLAADVERLAQRGATVAYLPTIDELPGDWWGLEGASTVLLAADGQVPTKLSTPSPQLAALATWVRMGGRLLLAVGAEAPEALKPGSPLAELAPGAFDSLVPLRQRTALETYAETTEPLSAAGPLELRVPKLTDVGGRIEAYAGLQPRDLPLVVRTPHGFGEVDVRGLRSWPATAGRLERPARSCSTGCCGGSVPNSARPTRKRWARSRRWASSTSRPVARALDQFQGVELVPFWLVALLSTLYIACIGPLDYFLVKRVLRRMEATWLTFTLTVVLFSAGAFALAYGLKGRELVVNQVDVVDFDAESSLVRGTTWLNLYSPRIDTYDLSLAAGPVAGQHRIEPPCCCRGWGCPAAVSAA